MLRFLISPVVFLSATGLMVALDVEDQKGGKLPDLRITSVPEGRLDPFRKDFKKYTNVFGVHFFATAQTPDDKILHAATVMAEYLDNNEDGTPDNPKVVHALASRDAYMVMTPDDDSGEDIDPEMWHLEGFVYGQFQHGEETNPGGERFDASLEEVLHLITAVGYANAYPEVFGLRRGTVVANCLDAARGGHFIFVPRTYPKDAWFFYDDDTCLYECQITEYLYWAITSMLGAQASEKRCQEISNEWVLCTRELVEKHDPQVYQLLTTPEYALPTRLPDGKYTVK